MTKRQPPTSPPSDQLAPEDAALWARVAGSAEPLRRGQDRARPGAAAAPVAPSAKPANPRRPVHASSPGPAPKTPPRRPAPPPLGRFDAREARGLRSGRVDIEARLDLHGMRQREAHAALQAFLVSAQARGDRLVLVITGKGAARGSVEAAPSDGPSGVLRQAVPRWLNEPALRQVVVSFAPAAPRHGGAGALYVRLRKAKI